MELYFKDQRHRNFFTEATKQFPQDCYHLSFLYLIGLTAETRQHFSSIYACDGINLDVLSAGWQTSTTYKITRLAFNLFNDCHTDDWTTETNTAAYTVSEIFATPYAPYLMEAVKLRYPSYFRTKKHDICPFHNAAREPGV